MSPPAPSVALLSLEPWDDTWRRNQHLVHQLVDLGLVRDVLFVEPSAPEPRSWVPEPGVRVLRPRRVLPRRAGGLVATAAWLRATALRRADVVWVNDPEIGVHCVGRAPALYDVTDDWRTFAPRPRIRRRIERAEDRLARKATTVVCSEVLAQRWRERYGVSARVVPNGVDPGAWSAVVPHHYDGPGPHVGYVGTLHQQRLDLDLVAAVAARPEVGTVHLVGPDAMAAPARERLVAMPGVQVHPPVPATQVPARTAGLDVLLCPHLVSAFTLSLDAIKSREYLASGRPVVATPTSGFQHLGAAVRLVGGGPREFAAAVVEALDDTAHEHLPGVGPDESWQARAADFAAVLRHLTSAHSERL